MIDKLKLNLEERSVIVTPKVPEVKYCFNPYSANNRHNRRRGKALARKNKLNN